LFGKPIVNELANGIRFFWLPTDKFKTVTMKMYIHQELRKELATGTALLPSVLKRGTQRYPETICLQRELENLYGAELSTSVGKKGERQLVEISLDMVHPGYLEEDNHLRRGLDILRSILSEPLVEEGGFRSAYVEQEKVQLGQEIKSLINNKTAYALERCIQEMCSHERFGIYKLGYVGGLTSIEPRGLYRYSRELLVENPIDLYMVGLRDREKIEEIVADTFSFARETTPRELPPTEISGNGREVLVREELMPVNQAQLVLGYRTNITLDHELYYPLAFYNGILGVFPHSKLFQNVREKASLAYFVFSRLEKHKGIMIIAAGIDPVHYCKSLEIIQAQTEAIADGEITRDEMENTRIGFINQLRSQADHPGNIINFHLDADIGGRHRGLDEVIEKIQQVTMEEVVAAARRVRLDTVYFLHGDGGEEKGHDS
jgi:predicted Zn-dependent peptidase